LEADKVKDQVRKLESFPRDVFKSDNEVQWKSTFENFGNTIKQIDDHVVALIEKTFSDKLNSSEGAFDLLAKF